jgi:hypothetical protein
MFAKPVPTKCPCRKFGGYTSTHLSIDGGKKTIGMIARSIFGQPYRRVPMGRAIRRIIDQA